MLANFLTWFFFFLSILVFLIFIPIWKMDWGTYTGLRMLGYGFIFKYDKHLSTWDLSWVVSRHVRVLCCAYYGVINKVIYFVLFLSFESWFFFCLISKVLNLDIKEIKDNCITTKNQTHHYCWAPHSKSKSNPLKFKKSSSWFHISVFHNLCRWTWHVLNAFTIC